MIAIRAVNAKDKIRDRAVAAGKIHKKKWSIWDNEIAMLWRESYVDSDDDSDGPAAKARAEKAAVLASERHKQKRAADRAAQEKFVNVNK